MQSTGTPARPAGRAGHRRRPAALVALSPPRCRRHALVTADLLHRGWLERIDLRVSDVVSGWGLRRLRPAYPLVWVRTQLGGAGARSSSSWPCCVGYLGWRRHTWLPLVRVLVALALLTAVVYAFKRGTGRTAPGYPGRLLLPPDGASLPVRARRQRRADVGGRPLAGREYGLPAPGAARLLDARRRRPGRHGGGHGARWTSTGSPTRWSVPAWASCCWAWFTHWTQWFCHAGYVPEQAGRPRSGVAGATAGARAESSGPPSSSAAPCPPPAEAAGPGARHRARSPTPAARALRPGGRRGPVPRDERRRRPGVGLPAGRHLPGRRRAHRRRRPVRPRGPGARPPTAPCGWPTPGTTTRSGPRSRSSRCGRTARPASTGSPTPTAPHDAEALLLAPDGTPYVVTKEILGRQRRLPARGAAGRRRHRRPGARWPRSTSPSPARPADRSGRPASCWSPGVRWPRGRQRHRAAHVHRRLRVAADRLGRRRRPRRRRRRGSRCPDRPRARRSASPRTAGSRRGQRGAAQRPSPSSRWRRRRGRADRRPRTPVPSLTDLTRSGLSPITTGLIAAAVATVIVWIGGKLRRRPPDRRPWCAVRPDGAVRRTGPRQTRRRTLTTRPRTVASSPGMGSYAGLCGISQTWPSRRL